MAKPKVYIRSAARQYDKPTERTIEYSLPTGKSSGPIGGLINLRVMDDGTLVVSLYNHDPEIKIVVGKAADDTHPIVSRNYGAAVIRFKRKPRKPAQK